MSMISSAKTIQAHTSALPLEAWGATDRGTLPPHNEDTIWPEGSTADLSDGRSLLLVADGVGGAEAGEQASRLAVDTIVAYCRQNSQTDPAQLLSPAVQAANQAVHTTLPQAATTVVVVLIKAGQAYIAHVGDSRAYLIREDRVEFITKDHTLTQQKIDSRRLLPEQARSDEDRNIITRSVGAEASVQVDLDVCSLQLGDTLLLCSDGLTDVLLDEEIVRLANRKSPQQAARRMIAEANRRGGPDNISVVIGRVGPTAPVPFNWPYLLLGLGGLLLLLACGLLLGGLFFNRSSRPVIAGSVLVTPTPSNPATLTEVSTPGTSSSPSATLLPAILSPVPPPTSTPLPTYTPVPIPTLNIQQPAPTPPPVLPTLPAAGPGQTPPSLPSLLPSPTLREPPEGAVAVRGRGMTFKWQWTGSLTDNQGFEIRIWREGDTDHFGAFDARELAKYTATEPNQVYAVAIPVEGAYSAQLHGGGDYWWTVAVVQLAPYQRIGQEAPPRRLTYTIPGPSGSDQDHNGSGGGSNGGRPDTAPSE